MPVPVFTAGETLDASEMNAVGLWRVTGCTVSSVGGTAATASNGVITIGTGNTSVTVSNAFSTDYDNYLVTYSGGTGSTSTFIKMTVGAAAANYYYAVNGHTYANAAANSGSANVAFMFGGWVDTAGSFANVNVVRPFASERTGFFMNTAVFSTTGFIYHGGGYLNDTNSYTAFTFTPNAGTLSGGTIRVYGYRK